MFNFLSLNVVCRTHREQGSGKTHVDVKIQSQLCLHQGNWDLESLSKLCKVECVMTQKKTLCVCRLPAELMYRVRSSWFSRQLLAGITICLALWFVGHPMNFSLAKLCNHQMQRAPHKLQKYHRLQEFPTNPNKSSRILIAR